MAEIVKMMERISAIILSKNNDDTLETCLKSVIDSLPYDKEIIVVDGESTDNTPNILAKYKDRIKVVYDEGKGLGLARNVGVQNCMYNIIACVDSDVICAKDHFLKILTYFKEHPEISALDVATETYPNIGTKVQKLESTFWKTATGITSQETLRGWSISFRREAFDAVKGFCKGGSDDNDFTFRLKTKGLHVVHLEADSWHIPRRTLLKLMKELKLWGRNGAYSYYKWGKTKTFENEVRSRKLYKLLHNARAMAIVAYTLSPIVGIKYLRKSKNVQLYIYFIVRQYSWLFGFFVGNMDIIFNRELYLEAIS